jgi:hypothetical protein
MNGIRKTFAIAAAVSLVCLSSVGAMAANKLIVMDSTGKVNKFMVTDSGYAGIGTTPSYPLHIVGAGGAEKTTLYMINNGRASGYLVTDSPIIYFMRNNFSSVNGGLPRNGDRLGSLLFGGAGKASASISVYASGTWSSTSKPGVISFQTTSPGYTYPTDKVRITSSGYVGIGTIAPAAKLDVSGGIRLNSTGTRPTNCTASISGLLWLNQSGNTDILSICAKVSGGYAWHNITLN